MKFFKLTIFLLSLSTFIACNESNNENQANSSDVETSVSPNQEVRPALEPGVKPYDIDNIKGTKLILAGSYLSPTDQVNRLTSTKGVDVSIYLMSNGLQMPFRLVSENENNKILQNADVVAPWEGRFQPGYIYTIHTGSMPANADNDQFKLQVQIKNK